MKLKRVIFPISNQKKKNYINKGIINNQKLSDFKKFIKHGKLYFKFIKYAKYIGSFYLVRVIEINKEKTDDRLNKVDFINKKVITLLSGKWNTSVSVAKDLYKKINKK